MIRARLTQEMKDRVESFLPEYMAYHGASASDRVEGTTERSSWGHRNRMGWLCEEAFCAAWGYGPPGYLDLKEDDGGEDYTVRLQGLHEAKLDIKGTTFSGRAAALLYKVEQKEKHGPADILLSALLREAEDDVLFLGWEHGAHIGRWPTRRLRGIKGQTFHAVPFGQLRSAQALHDVSNEEFADKIRAREKKRAAEAA